MNILIISSQLPYPPDNGGINRLYNIYRQFGQNHNLTWVCPIWEEHEIYVQEANHIYDELIQLPRDWRPDFPDRGWRKQLLRVVARLHWERLFEFCFDYVRAPGLYWLPASSERLALVDKVLSSSDFDLIICEFEGNAELVPNEIDIPKVLMFHNTQSTLFRRARQTYEISWEDRLFFWPELLKIMWYEKRRYSRFNFGVVVSEADQQLLYKRCPNLRTELIPNCVDVHYFHPVSDPGASSTLVYVGHYGYPPNSDAILYFCQEILPLIQSKIPDVQVLVVGRKPPDELRNYRGVQVLDFVSDVRTCFAKADVVIAPLRIGGGTRIKILEGLAMGKAIVSTTVGAEGLKVTHGENILLADSPGDFADCVIHLLNQPDLRTFLGKNGRKLVEQEYNCEILVAKLDQILQKVVDDYHVIRVDGKVRTMTLVDKQHAQS